MRTGSAITDPIRACPVIARPTMRSFSVNTERRDTRAHVRPPALANLDVLFGPDPDHSDHRLGAAFAHVYPAGGGYWRAWIFRDEKEVGFLNYYATKAEAVEAAWRWLGDEQRSRIYIRWCQYALVASLLTCAAIFQSRLAWWGVLPWSVAWLGAPLVARAVAHRRRGP